MRVAFLSMQQAFLDALNQQQSGLARVQEQVATGKRFTRAGQDPVAATQALGIDAALSANAQYLRNAGLAANRLGISESALVQVGELLHRVRELAVQAANGPLPLESRTLLAAEVRQRLDEMVALANTRDGNGEFLYAGYATSTQPFVRAGTAIAFQGDQGQRLVQVGPDRTIADSDSGATLFMQVPNGNGIYQVSTGAGNVGTGQVGDRTVIDASQYDRGNYTIAFTAPGSWEVLDATSAVIASGSYTPGQAISFRGLSIVINGAPAAGDQFQVAPSSAQSVFTTLEQFLAALAAPDGTARDRLSLATDLSNVMLNLDQALGRILEVRTGLGARLAAIESQQTQLSATDLDLQTTLSGLRDTDYASALTLLQQRLTSLEAAQKSFVRANGLSLFDYL